MGTNERLYAVIVTANRYGRNVVCELAEPPYDWNCPEHMQMRVLQPETGFAHVNELIRVEDAAHVWFDYTGIHLRHCIRETERR